jgi:hypothetical protein
VGKDKLARRALWKEIFIWLITLELKRRGFVQKAPNYALIEVDEMSTELFTKSANALDNDFDSVVVLWRAATEPPTLGKKFQIVKHAEQFPSRWSLLERCRDGFVFPLAVGVSKNSEQQALLKSQIFTFGGHCIATFANLTQYFELGAPLADSFKGPVLVAVANPNEIAFDERFLNLRSKGLRGESEAEDLARIAKIGSNPILAIAPTVVHNVDTQSVILLPSNQNRAELIEVLVRNPKLAKVVNVRVARLWNSVWSALGYAAADKVHPDQVRALAVHRSSRRPTPDELARAGTSLKILGGGR